MSIMKRCINTVVLIVFLIGISFGCADKKEKEIDKKKEKASISKPEEKNPAEKPTKKTEDIIVEVNGVPIKQQDIEPSQDCIKGYKRCFGIPESELPQVIRSDQQRWLVSKIEKIVIEQGIKKLNVKVAENDIKQFVNDFEKEVPSFSREAFDKWSKQALRLYEILEISLSDPQKADELYQKELSQFISNHAWKLYKGAATSLEKVRREKRLIPRTWDDMLKEIRKYAIRTLQYDTLGDAQRKKEGVKLEIKSEEIKVTYRKHYVIDSLSLKYFYSQNRSDLKKIKDRIKSGASVKSIIAEIMIKGKSIKVEEKSFTPPPLSIINPSSPKRDNLFQKQIYTLKSDDTTKIYKTSTAGDKEEYSFVYVANVKKKANIPPLSNVKGGLIRALKRAKLREFYKKWLDKELRTANIKVHNQQYADVVKKLQQE